MFANSESLERRPRRQGDGWTTTPDHRGSSTQTDRRGVKASVTDFRGVRNKEIRPKFNAGLMSTIQTLMAAGGSAAEGCAKGKQ
jgi:hypothetical protein